MEWIVRKLETSEPAATGEPASPQAGTRREITIKVEAETLERQLKRAVVRGRTSAFEIYCDEGPQLGGDNAAPPPLAYFSAGVAF